MSDRSAQSTRRRSREQAEPGLGAFGEPVDPTLGPPPVSEHLARWLRDAGLQWEPRPGDRFVVPDSELLDEFMVADMAVEVRHVPAGRIIAFNGTPEWATDSLMLADALWLPTEADLLAALGDAFASLARDVEGYAVRLVDDDTPHAATTPADALARALLAHLTR